MPLTTTDLVTYLRVPAAELDLTVLGQLVDIANGLVQEVTGPLAVEPARVQAIRLEAAARAYDNPRGLLSESIDDYTWRGGPGRGGVYLTDAERRELVSLTTGNPDPGPWAGSSPYRRYG